MSSTIDRDFDIYGPEDQARLLAAIKEMLEVTRDVRIIMKRRGSVKLTLELTHEKAERLIWSVKAGKLADFGVVEAEIINTTSPRRPKRSSAEWEIAASSTVSPFQLNVRRTGIVLRPNNSRVVIRPFSRQRESDRADPGPGHLALRGGGRPAVGGSDAEFRDRHQQTRQFFLQRFEQIRRHLLTDQPLSENRKLLIGAYFTQEYALESAALFNPSMVWHPDQSGLPEARAGSS